MEVQLAGKRFKPSERRYEHVVAALKQRTQTTTLLLLLQQAGGIPLPMDLQSCRGSCQARQLSHTSTGPSTPVQVPLPSRAAVDAAGATPEASHALLTELFEWLGAASCSGSSSSGSDSSGAGGWPLPPPLSELPSQQAALQTHTWRGFLSSQQVRRCLEALRPLVSAGKLPWAALGVWGFADAPVAWLGREHGVQRAMSNESHYMLLLLPDDSYCVFIGLGPNEGETT